MSVIFFDVSQELNANTNAGSTEGDNNILLTKTMPTFAFTVDKHKIYGTHGHKS